MGTAKRLSPSQPPENCPSPTASVTGCPSSFPPSPPLPLPPSLRQAAAEARIPAGIVAGALLEGHAEGLVSLWLVSLARRRGRIRAPAALLRWALRRGQLPAGMDHDAAKRGARGDLGCSRARAFAHQAARSAAKCGQVRTSAHFSRLSRRDQALIDRAREQLAARPGALARLERELAARLPAVSTAHRPPPTAYTARRSA